MSAKRSGSYHVVSTTAAPIICPLCDVAHTTVDSTLFNTYQYLYFTAGVYSPSGSQISLPSGTNMIGDGIRRTVINQSFKFNSSNVIGGGPQYGLTLGKGYNTSGATGTAFRIADGATNIRFNSVRFRAYNTAAEKKVFDMSDYAEWPQSGPSTASTVSPNRKCNSRNVEFNDCEFEYNGSNWWQFEIWWDVRENGGNIDDFTWNRCVFGCRNGAGKWPGVSGGSVIMGHILCQPSPAEHSYYGPRPNSSSAPGYPVDYGWDQWSSCTHGAGKSSEWNSPQGFLIKDSYFNGIDSTGGIDVCCNTRSYWFTTKMDGEDYYYQVHPTANCTDADRIVTPSLYNNDAWDVGTNTGWVLQNVWFGGGCRWEIGPYENAEWDEDGYRRDSKTTNSIPELVHAVWANDAFTGPATGGDARDEWIYRDHRGDGDSTYWSIDGVAIGVAPTWYNVPMKTVTNEQALYGLQPLGNIVQGPVGQIPTS